MIHGACTGRSRSLWSLVRGCYVILYLQHLNYLHTLNIINTLPLLKLCFVGTSIVLNNWFTFIIHDINYMFDMIGGLILVSHAPKR
ncbi:hypothetical protein Hanom_Chr17g01586431 [Helianthus anomalus]